MRTKQNVLGEKYSEQGKKFHTKIGIVLRTNEKCSKHIEE